MEASPSTWDIIAALEAKTGKKPTVTYGTLEDAKAARQHLLETDRENSMALLPVYLHIKMANGGGVVGDDVYDVKGYQKKTIADFI